MRIKMVYSLTLVCIISSALLAIVYQIAQPKIESDIRKKLISHLKEVFPDSIFICGRLYKYETPLKFEPAIQDTLWIVKDRNDKKVGIVFKVFPKGYAGTFEVLVGVNLDTIVTGVRPATPAEGLKETPGLGSKIVEPWFRNQFIGKKPFEILLKKDGGTLDAITGATISSRAVTNGIRLGIEKYKSFL